MISSREFHACSLNDQHAATGQHEDGEPAEPRLKRPRLPAACKLGQDADDDEDAEFEPHDKETNEYRRLSPKQIRTAARILSTLLKEMPADTAPGTEPARAIRLGTWFLEAIGLDYSLAASDRLNRCPDKPFSERLEMWVTSLAFIEEATLQTYWGRITCFQQDFQNHPSAYVRPGMISFCVFMPCSSSEAL